jgi:Tat protein translocase TatB subunit
MPSSLGPAEILVILVVALIVLGPNKLPQAGRQLGRALSEVRKWTSDMKSEIKTVVDFEDRPKYSSPEYPSSPTASTTVTADAQPLTSPGVPVTSPGTTVTSPGTTGDPDPAPPASAVDAEPDSAVAVDPPFIVAAESSTAAALEASTFTVESLAAGAVDLPGAGGPAVRTSSPEAPQGDSAHG